LWNPYSFSGYPLLATFHSATLNPANIFFVIFNDQNGWLFYTILPTFLMAITMFIFLKNLNLNFTSSLIGSIAYSFSGFAITWSQFGTMTYTMLYLPIILYLINKFKSQNKTYYLILPFVVFLFITSGNFQGIIYSALIAFFYWLYTQFSDITRKQLLWFISSLFLGILLSAIQILPTIELGQHSIRYEEKYASTYNYGLLPIAKIITTLAPDYFGNPATYNYWGFFNYHETILYLGVISTVAFISTLANYKYNSKNEIFFLLPDLFHYYSYLTLQSVASSMNLMSPAYQQASQEEYH